MVSRRRSQVASARSRQPESAQLEKLASRAANKRIQAVDRWEAIQTLAKLGTPEAVGALLPRFKFYVEPSISAQDEKQAAY